MKLLNTIFLGALILSSEALAQDLNQTVKIENTYEAAASKHVRQSLPITIPDSLKSFDYKFDYAVFETPYKGAFEFSPYKISLTPDAPVPVSSKHFYMRAGAGYQIRPELYAAWTPVSNEKISIDFHQALQGYWGKYRTVRTNLSEESPLFTTKGVRFDGYDFSEKAGVDFKFKGKHNVASLSLGYDGLFNKDFARSSKFNAVNFKAGFKAKQYKRGEFYYDFNLRARLSQDAIDVAAIDMKPLVERSYGISGRVAPKRGNALTLMVDFDLSYTDYKANGSDYSHSFFAGYALPKAEFRVGSFDLSIGANLNFAPLFNLAPDVRASVKVSDVIRFYASYTGNAEVFSYSRLKEKNPWFYAGIGDNLLSTIERMNITAGMSGSLWSHLQYNISGGFIAMDNDPMFGFSLSGVTSHSKGTLAQSLVYQEWKGWKGDLKLVWKSERVDADAFVSFRKTNILGGGNAVSGMMKALDPVAVCDLPLVSGTARFIYNWKKKVYAGLTADFATGRKLASFKGYETDDLQVQPYVDLGLYAEYKVSKKFSIYLRAKNLLDESIQRFPLHVENGIGATAGITLSL